MAARKTRKGKVLPIGSSPPRRPRTGKTPPLSGAPWGAGSYPSAPPVPPGGGPIPAYPILTEEVGYPPSPVANAGTQTSRSTTTGRGAALGPIVAKALQDVLGWKINGDDPKGFVGALNQSFQLTTVEGHVESKWTPRSYAVASDLAGGISGAQASLYSLAKTLLDQALPIIDGLYALDPAADAEYVAALKQLANSQLTELVNELAYLGGPRVMRVHQYFQMLLGITIKINPATPNTPVSITPEMPKHLPPGERPPPHPVANYWTYPDGVLGTLGNMRDQLGLAEPTRKADKERSYINTVADEQNVTNFRILVDYTNSLLNSWQNSFQFFFLNTATPFLGTQLVLISRQLGVISETVDEVRFVLDSVFLGPAERKTYTLQLANLITDPMTGTLAPLPQIFLEDLLLWIQNYVTDEAPAVIQSGGRLALGEDFANMAWQFVVHTYATYLFAQTQGGSPIATDRVLFSLSKL
ncbi:MAG TPA: hypothetical protein VEK12_11785, partial [Alphaproteobacteria bacterium]|nr:hypothetical protein [Alphaproteobacteria bacterium]